MGNTLVPLSDLEYFSKILSLGISEKDHEIEQNSILSTRHSLVQSENSQPLFFAYQLSVPDVNGD